MPTPEGPWTLRPNPCSAEAKRQENALRSDGPLRVTGARARSAVCTAEYAQPFNRSRVAADGTFVADTSTEVAGPGGRREAIYRARDGIWVWRIEWPRPTARESGLTPFEAWLGKPWPRTLAFFLAVLLVLAAAVEFALGRLFAALTR